MSEQMPCSWESAFLENIAELVRGVTFPTTDKHHQPSEGLIACLRTSNVQSVVEWSDLWFIPERHVKHPEQLVRVDDVLISTANSYELVGKVARVSRLPMRSTLGAFISVLRARTGIDAGFFYYQMVSDQIQRAIRDMSSTTTNISNVSGAKLRQLSLKIAPAAEQTRIVEKLEELLSDLDAGVAELKAAQKKLQQYRQSLLKAAVEGRLTAAWRDARRDDSPGENGADLLARILRERRACWEAQQLAKFEAQGKTPPIGWQGKYPEPVQPELTGLPVLPAAWAWASLDMLGEIASGVAKGTKRGEAIPVREVPYLRVANVQRGFLDLSEVKTILATERDIEALTLRAGDVLFNEGGDRDKLGRGWVWRDEVPDCIHQNHVFRMRPIVDEVNSEFVSHHGNTFGKQWFQSAGKQTTNLASINMGMLRAFPVPVPPAEEQRIIVAQLVAQLETLSAQDQAVEKAMQQSAAQRKNVLRAAFAGQLVTQDPADEPATVLLGRIQAERLQKPKQAKTRASSTRKEVKNMVNCLIDVLAKEAGWLSAQEAFRRCGMADGATTDHIERLYAELRALSKAGQIAIEPLRDEAGRKVGDQLRLLGD